MQCYANLAVLVHYARRLHQSKYQEAPLGSTQIDFRVCVASRVDTYTLGVSTAAQEYCTVPNRCSGVLDLEAPVGLQIGC